MRLKNELIKNRYYRMKMPKPITNEFERIERLVKKEEEKLEGVEFD